MQAVGHVTPWGIPCGLAKHLSYWLRHVTRPCFMYAEDPPNWYPTVEDWGMDVQRIWRRGKADGLEHVQEAAMLDGLRLVHWQWDPSFFPWRTINAYGEWARRFGVRTVVTIHTLEDNPVFTYPNKALLRNADVLVVATPGMKAAWEDYAAGFHITVRHPIRVIPLPVPPLSYGGAGYPSTASPGPIILTWGMLGKLKGHLPVWQAVQHLRSHGMPNARYVVAGQAITGEQKQNLDALQAEAKDSGGALEVRAGFVPELELYDLCRSVDVIVLNYQWEHQSSSGAGAISVASGTPVVTSRSPMFASCKDAVYRCGKEPEEIAAAIESVLADPSALMRGRAELLPSITGETVARQYEEAYSYLEAA